MKKKILATLLAITLFVGIAVPAAIAASSDAAGDAKKVSKITIAEATYTIVQGETKDFADQIAVYENDTKLVLDHGHIQYSLLANVGASSDFEIVGSTVKALKPGATATLTVFDNYGEKARTTATIKSVAPSASASKAIESFTFAKSLYTLPVGVGAEDQKIVIESHPKGTTFDAAAKTAADTAVIAALGAATPALTTTAGTPIEGGTKIEYTILAADLAAEAATTANSSVVATCDNFLTTVTSNFTATTAFRLVTAVPAAGVNIGNEMTVKVGERVALPTVTYYPTNANVNKAVTWSIEAFVNDGNAYQYAVVDGDKVLGVNSNTPGKARLKAALPSGSATETIVNVKSASFAGLVTPTLPSTLKVATGKTATLAISNLPAGVTATWKSETAAVATVTNGVVKGVKAGTSKVTATLSTGEVLTCVVTVSGTATPVAPVAPVTDKPSTNPQTSDSFFKF